VRERVHQPCEAFPRWATVPIAERYHGEQQPGVRLQSMAACGGRSPYGHPGCLLGLSTTDLQKPVEQGWWQTAHTLGVCCTN
jgi:hypothetical protein